MHLKTKSHKVKKEMGVTKQIKHFSLLRTPATSRWLPPSGPTSTNRMFPKHFESKPGSKKSRITLVSRAVWHNHRRTQILACLWILLSLQLNQRDQENKPPEKEQHRFKAGRNYLKTTSKIQTTNPDARK